MILFQRTVQISEKWMYQCVAPVTTRPHSKNDTTTQHKNTRPTSPYPHDDGDDGGGDAGGSCGRAGAGGGEDISSMMLQ